MAKGKRIPLEKLQKHMEEQARNKATQRIASQDISFMLFLRIYSFLNHHDRVLLQSKFIVRRAAFVNPFFHAISEHPDLWEPLFKTKIKSIWKDDTTWKAFMRIDGTKDVPWKQSFFELDRNTTRDEAFHVIRGAHPGCREKFDSDARLKRSTALTGINNISLSVGSSFPTGLLFSSSRPSQDAEAQIRLWSAYPVDVPAPREGDSEYILRRGTLAGSEGLHNPSKFTIKNIATCPVGERTTKMFPVFTYFNQDESAWEYACVAGDEKGEVAYYTGGITATGPATPMAPTPLLQTAGSVVALKCILEEREYVGFRQMYACGINDSGQLYDLQENDTVCKFSHDDSLTTDCVDVSIDASIFALGQTQRKGALINGVVRVFENTPTGVTATTNYACGPSINIKCIKFLEPGVNMNGSMITPDTFIYSSRDGIAMFDRRAGKPQVKFVSGSPVDQFCTIAVRQLIAATCGPELMLWDVRTQRIIRKVTHGHTYCASIDCDQGIYPNTTTPNVIVTGGTEGTIRFWNVNHFWRTRETAREREFVGSGMGRGRGRGRGPLQPERPAPVDPNPEEDAERRKGSRRNLKEGSPTPPALIDGQAAGTDTNGTVPRNVSQAVVNEMVTSGGTQAAPAFATQQHIQHQHQPQHGPRGREMHQHSYSQAAAAHHHHQHFHQHHLQNQIPHQHQHPHSAYSSAAQFTPTTPTAFAGRPAPPPHRGGARGPAGNRMEMLDRSQMGQYAPPLDNSTPNGVPPPATAGFPTLAPGVRPPPPPPPRVLPAEEQPYLSAPPPWMKPPEAVLPSGRGIFAPWARGPPPQGTPPVFPPAHYPPTYPPMPMYPAQQMVPPTVTPPAYSAPPYYQPQQQAPAAGPYTPVIATPDAPICAYFARGICRFDLRCKYRHVGEDIGAGNTIVGSIDMLEEDVPE
eukprot:TRINITY_DN5940_c1_g1_i5.p1 TRINITY_DN5940_c1_g1~~TRINITY_DN5940_c1_g1_i5.p1  ORF type:complete len:919 (-),score=85.85 TRINITY_DN5940_c1_g1_i5:83-2839(-)